MKHLIIIPLLLVWGILYSQEKDSTNIYKKRVLENVEIDFLTSLYAQDGEHAAVTGGVGSEKLNDAASAIVIAIPLNADDVLTIDGEVSAYSSASSSNLNPFDTRGVNTKGSPWVESSGASKQDVWTNGKISYAHNSDNRNNIFGVNINLANEFDYMSFGGGASYAHLFNEKNTELSIKANVYLDTWNPRYPIEIISDVSSGGSLNWGYFAGVPIYDENGTSVDKNSATTWGATNSELVVDKKRNSYSLSISLSQIINEKSQFSIFFDLVKQVGWLSNPMQRVYFADIDNFYVGNPLNIPNYTSPTNTDVFQLADDIERLPNSRMKLPIGLRYHFYVNEHIVLRSYYRFYFDDWGLVSHTAKLEIPIKVGAKFTLYPAYRFYTQTAADYFAAYDTHLSSEEFYTSDNDLSKYQSNQYSFGIGYTDIFLDHRIKQLALKNMDLNYSFYKRNTGFTAGILTIGLKFVID